MIILSNEILAKAKSDLTNIERKLWIQAYVSRKENPLIDLIGSVLLFGCSYLALHRYFTEGTPFSFWVHAAAFVGITLCISIAHRCLNKQLTCKAERICPITASQFNPEEISDLSQLDKVTSHGYFEKGKTYYAGPLTALVSIVAWIFSFLWFTKFQNLSTPSDCILYLIAMCIATSIWFFMTGLLAGQSLELPLSPEVRSALRKYRKEKKEEAERVHLAELEKAKAEQEEKARAEAKAKAEAEAKAKAEAEQKEKEAASSNQASAPALYRDLPFYQQCREAARIRYGGSPSPSKYNRTLTYAEKVDYINRKCCGMYSYHGIETIEKDPDLTPSQKEDLKRFLMVYGD